MKLLLVEDDWGLALGVKQNLQQQGYSIDHFDSVKTALNACAQAIYDLVILDLGLPDADGLVFLKEYRKKSDHPVIILTARDGIEHKINGLDLGADDYLAKPFDQTELQARIRALLRRSHGISENVLTVNQVHIDLGSRVVKVNNEMISLPRREFNLLEVLMQNQGKVMTRYSLEQTLYSWDDDIESNALEVHIHNLRKKISKQFISTIRGVGYMVNKHDS